MRSTNSDGISMPNFLVAHYRERGNTVWYRIDASMHQLPTWIGKRITSVNNKITLRESLHTSPQINKTEPQNIIDYNQEKN